LIELHRLTPQPIKFVINTHYHGDHVAGNGVFASAGALMLAQRNVRDWIHTENLRMTTEGMASEHLVITAEQRSCIEGFVAPTAVYENRVDLYLDSRLLEVRSFPGHTGGDSVVIVPDAKVVFAGDLFWRNTAPNTIDASTKPWIDTLNALAENQGDYVFVPGHGDVGKAPDVRAFRDYLTTLRRLVAEAQGEGKSGVAVVDAVLPQMTARYEKWAYFKDEAEANITQMDAELHGTKRFPTSALSDPKD
jgi:glyoxylase-like metal-dependent hydrolase (beta-lactamase superfamily II)